MDNLKCETRLFWPVIVSAPLGPIFFAGALMVSLSALSACGGGGGGGSASAGRVVVTQQPAIRGDDRLPLSFGPAYESEFNAQTGLDDIGVASAYDKGYAGFNVRTGVADTGVYQAHSQLSHVEGGYDFHGSSHGLSDPDGHGTHVASLMAARRDGKAMHGVAPHAAVKSYRIFNGGGSFGSKSGSQIMPTLVSQAIAHDIHLLNNSWASNYEVTDFSKSTTKSVLGSELSAWDKAVKAGMVMVWAAGNDGDDQVSVRAGLPYHYSDMKKGWLAVVSFDPFGKEPRYTNRCGVARDWCLAAPGGGDSVGSFGLYGARSGGGYERRSGTSMAAPHVSGALALVLDAFPQLTPQQGAARLLQTATYEGLTTADGCTIAKCTPADMADVFGQGRVSLDDALAPIGTLSLVTAAAPVSLEETILDSGFVVDKALFSAMTRVRFMAQDSFDNAAFSVPATAFLARPKQRFSDDSTRATAYFAPSAISQEAQFYISDAGTFPAEQMGHGRLGDISQRSMQNWTGLSADDEVGQWGAHFGYDENRQVMMFSRHLGDASSDGRTGSQADSWLSLGFDKSQGQFLDSQGTAGLAWGKGQSHWLTAGHYQAHAFGGATSFEYQRGRSDVTGSDNCLICSAEASFERWELAYQVPLGATGVGTQSQNVTLALHQPLHVTQASFDIVGAEQGPVNVRPSRPQREAVMRLTSPALGGRVGLSHHMMIQQDKGGVAHQLMANWTVSF